MKEVVLNNLLDLIIKYKNYNKTKLLEIRYGLEVLYLTITKFVVISIITLLLGIFKEFVLLFFIYGILRTTGFGLHTNNSKDCYIISIITYITFPILIKYLNIEELYLLITSIISLIIIIIFSPADTKKRPLINKKKRIILKIITSFISIVYIILIFIIKSNYYKNILLFSLILEALAVNPISYKLLGLRYNNHKAYNRKGVK